MRRFLTTLLGGRLRIVLIASFALVAALTVGVNTIVVTRVIEDYLAGLMAERVARDMNLAATFYQIKLDEIVTVGRRVSQDPQMIENLPAAFQGQPEAIQNVDQVINRKIAVPTLGGTHLIALFDAEGNILMSRILTPEGELSSVTAQGNWGSLPIVKDALSANAARSGTEVIPAELLAQVGLGQQAHVALIPTEQAAPEPFDPREGTAGLALTGVYPLQDRDGQTIGVILSAYLFNNDFTLVDRIKEAAEIDTVTIFFGDLRVSTNVRNEDGTRAVGTRVSQKVFDVVLVQERDYVGRAYVVNDWFITRYMPLHDHLGQVVGSLYVGARESAFLGLVDTVNNRVALIALICIALAAVIAVPIAQVVVRPVTALVGATRRLAQGDMTVRVETYGTGELAMLGRAFNSMAETMHKTQQELLHKEKLASMGQLAAGVAHEINNPLATILLFSEAMHKETSEGDSQRDDLKMIISETTRCKNIVADLLNFARQQEVLAQETDVHALLEQVIAGLCHQPSFEQIEIVHRFSPSLPLIQADPDQLQQVFINLLNNAAEAVTGSGTITLATRLVDSQWVEIQVSDTGCGIPEENLGKLFTPFFTTKPPGKGTGLGLSIVYGIVKMHRGQITVQSQEGKGTTFTITLPTYLPKEGLNTSFGSTPEVIG